MAGLLPIRTGSRDAATALLLMIAMLSLSTACKKDAAPKAPAPKGANGDQLETLNDEKKDPADDVEDDGEDEDAEGGEESSIAIAPQSLTDLNVPETGAVSIRFTLTGVDDQDVIVGLSESPTGVALVKSGNTVTFGWASPTKGSHTLRFILRDREACEAEEDDPADCEIAAADFGKIGAKSYDISSERFTLNVGTGTGGGAGGGAGGDLIAQIIGLLGGGGGGAGGLQDLLKGLSTTQLTQVLGLAQSGFDISQITALLGL